MLMRIERLVVRPLENNVYVVIDEQTREAVVVDVALGADALQRRVRELGVKVTSIVNTHGHADHVAENATAQRVLKAPLAIHELDEYRLLKNTRETRTYLPKSAEFSKADRLLKEGDDVSVGRQSLQVLHTPGHTEGSICLFNAAAQILISGDTLFAGSFGRTDDVGGNARQMMASLRRLAQLPSPTRVYPGHGPDTTIGDEATWIQTDYLERLLGVE